MGCGIVAVVSAFKALKHFVKKIKLSAFFRASRANKVSVSVTTDRAQMLYNREPVSLMHQKTVFDQLINQFSSLSVIVFNRLNSFFRAQMDIGAKGELLHV